MVDRFRVTLDPSLLQVACCIVGALLLIAVIRIILLIRACRRLRTECARMEKQSAEQQMEITAMLHDAQSWRARFQRQFDAMRGDLAHRLSQSEKSNEHAQDVLDQAQQAVLGTALARVAELEARLAAGPTLSPPAPDGPRPPKVSGPVLPPLPSIEGLRLQAAEAELNSLRNLLAAARHETTALRRALMMAKKKEHSPQRRITRRHQGTN